MMMIRILHKSFKGSCFFIILIIKYNINKKISKYNKMLDSDKYLIYNTSMKYEIKH
jgi:hypothetical protein